MPARGARTYKVYARSIFLRNQVYGMQSPAIDIAGSCAHGSVLPELSSAPSPFFLPFWSESISEYQSFNQSRRSAVHFMV